MTLKFAEVYWGGMGQRPMNILLNGTTVETNFDASAAAGGSFRAIDRQYTVSVTTGQIVIELDPVSGSTPSINGIEIVAAGGSGPNLITNYTYDLFNRLTQVSMPRGSVTQTRTFTYDGTTQRLASVTNPENGTVTYTYNGDGTLATKVDAKNQKIEYIYDSFQRLTTIKRYPVSTGAEDACQRVTFTYGTASPSNGRLVTASWGGATCVNTGNRAFTDSYTYSNPGSVLTKSLGVATGTLTATYTYDTEGKTTSVAYPPSGPTYTYSFDSLGRPNKLTDNSAVDWVKDVLYGPAGELTQMRYWSGGPSYYLETKQYNARLQMTRVTTADEWGLLPKLMDLEYRYSPTSNNGRITSQKDYVSGEEVTYTYDNLTRLLTAVTSDPPAGENWGPQWGQSFGYDGFGNLLQQTVTKGTAPALSINVDGQTNRITTAGYGYDANGNLTAMPGQTGMTYDVENRLATASGDTYAYGPDNKRVWKKKPDGTEEFYFYGLGAQKLGAYRFVGGALTVVTTNLYFAGKTIRAQGQTVVTDRLGSVRYAGGTTSRYFPYGQEQVVTGQDREKFGTYYRDGTTGLDYADQRYYGSTVGRFLTADPYTATAASSSNPAQPRSWNRHAYVEGDPVNYSDPPGLYPQQVDPEGIPEYINCNGVWLPPGACQLLYGRLPAGYGNPTAGRVDPNEITPARRATELRKLVNNPNPELRVGDCRALATFADATWADRLFQQTESISSWVKDFGQFVPGSSRLVELARASGFDIGSVVNYRPLLDAGGTSSFRPEYQESVSPQNCPDQAHHFAAFFQFRFLAGQSAASVAAVLIDIYPNNPGDRALGLAAAELGARISSGALKPQDLGGEIRKKLCK